MTAIKPKHQQLYDILVQKLHQGVYPAGGKLPSMNELARRYSVSVNVVTKAVDELKKADLVETVAGNGIYSKIDKGMAAGESHFAGENVFSVSWMTKTITVWVEDAADWQVAFWNRFFEHTVTDKPDMELVVNYGAENPPGTDTVDMFIGGSGFIGGQGLSLKDFHDGGVINDFYPDAYKGKLLTPDDTVWNGRRVGMPVGFILPVIVHREQVLNAEDYDGVLKFVDDVIRKKKGPARYKIWSLLEFLAGEGFDCFDVRSGTFAASSEWWEILNRIKSLYTDGSLLHMHNLPLDMDKLIDDELGETVQYLELAINQSRVTQGRPVHVSPCPLGNVVPLNPVCACISRKSPYPEECARMVVDMLEDDIQEHYFHERLGFPVNATALKGTEFAFYSNRIPTMDKHWVLPPEKTLQRLLQLLLLWELHFYFTGKIRGDVVERINRKAAYFLASVNENGGVE
ncbi:MAG: winged helix-turn-helix domain-containing protein [Candidatus Pacebacteria bacterium]|nr:winged helix-turn-helix domain-containing protein [Candidatus Paceibacterota bacterium]